MAMKAKIILAEAATGHPDGTVSILRGGITGASGKQAPYPFRGCLVVRIEAEIGDKGKHSFDLRFMDEDGGDVLPPLQGQFDVPKGGGFINFVLGIAVKFPKEGRFTFSLRVDQVELDTWSLAVRKKTGEAGNEQDASNT